MTYVDGFVLPIPDKNVAAYKKMARLAAKVWIAHGALHYVECMGDDVKSGKVTSFPQAVKLKAGESAWFSFIVYRSRKHRDDVLKKVMSDKRLQASMDPKKLPFDGMRMFWGGFKTMIDVKAGASPKRRKKRARA